MSKTRIDTRSLCSDLVMLEWKDQDGWMHELTAVLEDISPQGGCLQVESQVPENTVVQIRHGQWGMVCRTVYCEFREIGYFIGLEFAEGEYWSKSAFNPQHLLNLTDLMNGLNQRSVN